MAALAWLLIPLVAAIAAGLWGSWANRTRKVRGDGPELDGYARFRAAMEKSDSGAVVRDGGASRCADRGVPYCRGMPRRTATMLASTLMLIALLCAGVLIPVPYAEMSPGPTVNTLADHEASRCCRSPGARPTRRTVTST